jgi:B12-binding domain/radical SAM domain protein
MPTNALAFVFRADNRQSISPLIGAIEMDKRLDGLEIYLLKPRLGLGKQIVDLATSYDTVIVGWSFTTPRVPTVLNAVKKIRAYLRSRHLSNVTLVAGGPHPSGDWQHTLDMGFDAAVVGEAEISFPQLLVALCETTGLEHIKGHAHRNGTGSHFSGRSARVENLDDYPPFAERFSLFSSIEITRGCPWACRYCQTTSLFGARMRHRSVDDIVRWTEVSKRHDRSEMRFITPDAFAYGSDGRDLRLDKLAEMLKGVNGVVGKEHTYLGSFPSEVRPESVSREAVELVREYAVNDNILIGAQSGSQRMLDLAHRGNTVEDVYRAVRVTLGAGLVANVDFIFGMPGETETDRDRTIEVIEDLAAMGARIHSHTFMPLAGTPWADAPPGHIDEKTLCLLEHLTGKGQHFGQWRRQQQAAKEIVKLRRTLQ